MTRRGLRFALLVGVLVGLAFPGSAAAEQLTLTVVGNGVVSGTYGFLGSQTLDCGPSETCEFEIPRVCPGIDPSCSPAQRVPQTVELTAGAPPSEWVFVEWGGHCSGSDTDCSLTMDMDRSVTATYRRQLGRIVFTSERDGNEQIYVMNADGSGQTRLTNNAFRDDHASWSPDRRRIAFARQTGGVVTLHVMNADGSGEMLVASGATEPSWSPDGQRFAFTSRRDGNAEIYVMNADGSGQTRLTNNFVSDTHPNWSPDGRQIVFTRSEPNDIYVMSADGSGQMPLTSTPEPEGDAAWSPDGQKIVFQRFSSGFGSGDAYVMNANGSGQMPLTNSPERENNPVWSPDGQQIAFSRSTGMAQEIHVMNADGSGQTILPGDPSEHDRSPSWTSASVRSQLFVSKTGSGSGTVSSTSGIDCGGDCWELYEPGAQVTLSAVAANGSVFVAWGGACSGTQPTCTVTMDNSKSVTATFFALPITQAPGPQGPCTHTGTAGNDRITGTPGDDVICAGAGRDVVRGLGGNDVILLGAGNDEGYGGAGKDRIIGGRGKDRLFGGGGNDTLLAKDRVKREIVDGGAGRKDVCRTNRGDIRRRCP